jgi:hypothetical protein
MSNIGYESPKGLEKLGSFVKRGGIELATGTPLLPAKIALAVGFLTLNPQMMWDATAAGLVGAAVLGSAYLIHSKTKDMLNGRVGSKKWDKLKTDLATEFLTAEYKTPNKSVLSFALKAHDLMIINDEELRRLSLNKFVDSELPSFKKKMIDIRGEDAAPIVQNDEPKSDYAGAKPSDEPPVKSRDPEIVNTYVSLPGQPFKL